MKTMIETLSRARNAKDTKMTTEVRSPRVIRGANRIEGPVQWLDTPRFARPSPRTAGGLFTLTAIAATLLLTAQPAFAQVDPDCTGSNPGTVTCNGPTGTPPGPAVYADGVTHTATGDLTVNVGNGVTSFGTGGFITTATGDADITMTKGTGNMSNSATTGTRAPIVVGATSEAGDIHISTSAFIQGAAAHVQYGISAVSTGGGDIQIDTAAVTVSTTAGTPAVAALRAISNGGNIVLNNVGLSGPIGGLVQTSGSGTVTISNSTGSRYQVTTVDGDITATGATGLFMSQAGDVTIDQARAGITTQTGGQSTINYVGTATIWSTNAMADFAVRSRGTGDVSVNTAGRAEFDLFGGERDGGSGVGSGLNRLGTVVAAPFDFSESGGAAELTLSRGSGWFISDPEAFNDTSRPMSLTAGRNRFSAQGDLVTIDAGAVLSTSTLGNGSGDTGIAPNAVQRSQLLSAPAERLRYRVDFGGGEDVVKLAGDLFVGALYNQRGSDLDIGFHELRLENLETLEAAGRVWLGARFGDTTGGGATGNFSGLTDSRTDDILGLPGTHFVGALDADGQALSRIYADVNVGAVGQANGCGLEFRGDNKRLPVTDCLDLRGGHATGRSLFILTQTIPGDRGAYNPEGSVIVDVSGANAAQTDPQAFGVAPESFQYGELADGTGIIDKGLFFYTIQYDAEDEQYKLYGLPGDGSQQFPLLTTAANRLWQRAAGSWFERQVDQRDLAKDTDVGTGLWFRSSVASTDRDLITPIVAGTALLDFDNSYSQDDVTTTFGWDWIGRSNEEGALVAGVMLGYVRSKLEYDNGPNTANLEGMHAGAYASLTRGGFYLDGAIAQTWLDVQNDVPALELTPDTAQLDTRGKSLGGRLEGGWRIPVGIVQIEPLAGLSWVKTNIDDINVPAGDPARIGGDVRFKGVSSNNVSYGLRLAMDNLMASVMPLGISLTARQIEEIHGRSEVVINNIGPIPATTVDELDGTFTQLTGSLSLSNVKRTLAGYVNVDSLSGNDVSSLGFSAGVRYEW